MEMYQKTKEAVLEEIQSNENGLTNKEAKHRLEQFGYNEIKNQEKVPTWKLFLENLKDPMVIILLVAAGVQVVLGEIAESLIIFLVLILNAVISVIQTKKAEGSLEALRNLSAPEANVNREGKTHKIPVREVVPGDIVFIEAGDYIPADGRIISSESLKVNEGMLTGESEAVLKNTSAISETASLGDRLNMVYSSALVVNGRGKFVVTGTAEKTEIGKIADLISTAEEKQTPLQRKLEAFSKKLGIAIILLSVLIFAVQMIRIAVGEVADNSEQAILDALMFSVAVAVAAIPEALASIVTIVLSVGTNTMAKENAIIRKLPAVETLGSTSVICTDKTGTLTQNKMTVMDLFIGENKESDKLNEQSIRKLSLIAALCNDSYLNSDDKEVGDPTELALIHFVNKEFDNYEKIRASFPRVGELPFDSERKLMSTVHQIDEQTVMLTKGGPDVIFNRATHVLSNGEVVALTKDMLNEWEQANENFSKQALRALAFAYKQLPKGQTTVKAEDEYNLILVGLTALIDPPREEVYSSIEEAEKAGIRTVMITGDHKTTAQAIGRDIGLIRHGDLALTGEELDRLTDEELDGKLAKISVYARVSPENKIRIVRAWQKKNLIVAMTGDGVNDAPALKQADIGVAMGSGTDVAKDASAMILTDNNFVSIVKAVRVGRTVYDNIKKAIAYLFAGNLGAIIAILYAVIFNLPNPFTALQLLFINLVNDSLPAIALGMEKSEPDVMKRKPRKLAEGIFSGGTLTTVITRGSIIGITVIISFHIGLSISTDMGVAMAFTTLILARTLQTFSARSNTQSALKVGVFSNKYVFIAVLVGIVLYGVTLLPFARDVFNIPADFGLYEGVIAAVLAVVALIVMEIAKVLKVSLKRD